MDLQEFIKAKRELEVNIRLEIQAQIDHFQRETGLSPDGVYIDMYRVARLGLPSTYEYVINTVTVTVPIK